MNRVQIPPSKRAPSNQLPDGTSEWRGPTAGVIVFPASSRSRKRSGGLKSKHCGGCRSAAAHPKHRSFCDGIIDRRLTLMLIPAKLVWSDTARFALALDESANSTQSHVVQLGNFHTGTAGLDRSNDTFAQIIGIRLPHS